MAGRTCTFVISWTQTTIDGLKGAPTAALESGSPWSWHGRAVRVDGGAGIISVDDPSGHAELQSRAQAAARRIVGRMACSGRALEGPDFDTPLLGQSFKVTDGRNVWTGTLVEVAEAARPLVMFLGALPPAGRGLAVLEGLSTENHLNRVSDMPTGVICFVRGTRLRTPGGDIAVEDLCEGDRLETADGPAEEIAWIGTRRMTGARLHALPELRPVRILAGALGEDGPKDDLLVSPRHRMLVRGQAARALFNTEEVLVAAEDLVNDRTILRDHTLNTVDYFHVLLPRHHVVWANGQESESFHPASTNPSVIDPHEFARLREVMPEAANAPASYGPSARREISRSEAAILRHEASGHG